MERIKSYTNLEQSKKLAEILPLESADAFYPWRELMKDYDSIYVPEKMLMSDIEEDDVLAWSLAALLNILPNNKHIATTLSRGVWKIEPVEYIDKWFCEYEDRVEEDIPCKKFSMSADNPIDACVAMIEKLNELNLL